MPYDMPSNQTGILSFFKYINNTLQVSGQGILGIGTLIVLWLIVFSISRRISDNQRAVMSASFFVSVISIFFFITGMVGLAVVLVCITATIVSIMFVRFVK